MMPPAVRCTALLVALCAAVFSQEPPRYFELRLPEFADRAFDSGAAVIELPSRPIRHLEIQLLEASARGVSYGQIFVRINGKGAGNALDRRSNDRGILLLMNPSTLAMRPDELFDSRENAIEVSAVDRRNRRYYQNWVVRTEGSGQNPWFTYASAISPDDPRGVPPDLILHEPAAPPLIRLGQKEASVRVRGTVAAAAAGAAVTLNGQPFLDATAKASADFDKVVPLLRDRRELLLEATDKKGNKRSVTIPVQIEEKTPPKIRFAGKRYALIIGISRYGTSKTAPPPLPFAAVSASELAARLESRAGFARENIRLLIDEQASADQIRTGFRDFAAKASREDLLVIFVAAHGVHDPARPDNIYLAPYGTQMPQISATAIEFPDLDVLLKNSIRSNNTLLIFDVGHKIESEWRFPGKNLINNYLLSLFSEETGRAVLVSGGADQTSLDRGSAHLFTHWLLEGLAGQADANRDRVVTPAELFKFAAQQVQTESEGKQTPRFRLAQSSQNEPVFTLGPPPK